MNLVFFLATVLLAVMLRRHSRQGSVNGGDTYEAKSLCWAFLASQVFVVFLSSLYIASQLGWTSSPDIGAGVRYLSDQSNFVVLSTFPVLGVLLAMVFLMRNNGLSWASVGMKAPRFGMRLIAVYVIALLLGLLAVEALWNAAFSQESEVLSPGELSIQSIDGYSKILYAGWLIVVTPIVEELFFRGIIYNVLARLTSEWGGLVLQACLFSLMHNDFEYFFVFFAAGIVFGWIYQKSGSLVPGIVIHSLHSTVVFINAS